MSIRFVPLFLHAGVIRGGVIPSILKINIINHNLSAVVFFVAFSRAPEAGRAGCMLAVLGVMPVAAAFKADVELALVLKMIAHAYIAAVFYRLGAHSLDMSRLPASMADNGVAGLLLKVPVFDFLLIE